MAETGTVASIIGVAGAGVRLSLIVNAISCEVAQAPPEIHAIAKTLTLFSLILKRTGVVFQAANSVHKHEAIEAAKDIADEGNQIFDEIYDMLDRVRSKSDDGNLKVTVQQKIKLCFKRNRIAYLLGHLESLKLSLSLMIQVLQLGRLMASTSKSDPPDVVKDKSAAIQQERAEAQNTLIVRYMQVKETQRLFGEYTKGDSAPQSPDESKDDTDNDSQVTIRSPPEYNSYLSLVQLPSHSLGDIDSMLKQMGNSSKDMVRISDQAVGLLLDKWTRWNDIREQRHAKPSSGRYTPTVHSLNEDDIPYYERYSEREDSPRGYYIEGTTHDWRQPNSAAARQEYVKRKKQYTGYQPSVSTHSSDQEDSPASNASSKKNTKRHVINSSSDSSDSEMETKTRRPASKFQPGPPLDRSVSNQQASNRSTPPSGQPPPRMPPSPAQSVGSKQSISPQYIPPAGGRPYITPDQNAHHYHSFSAPLPPIYTHNAPNPYATASPQSPAYNPPPYYGHAGGPPMPRQYPPMSSRMNASTRPISRDGKGTRSPSRLSQEMPYGSDWDRDRDRERTRERDKYYDRDFMRERERDREPPRSDKKYKESRTKALREGATKGILGGMALGGFLEALEGLSL